MTRGGNIAHLGRNKNPLRESLKDIMITPSRATKFRLSMSAGEGVGQERKPGYGGNRKVTLSAGE